PRIPTMKEELLSHIELTPEPIDLTTEESNENGNLIDLTTEESNENGNLATELPENVSTLSSPIHYESDKENNGYSEMDVIDFCTLTVVLKSQEVIKRIKEAYQNDPLYATFYEEAKDKYEAI